MLRHVCAAIVLAAVGSVLTAGSASAEVDRTVTAVRETRALFDDEAGCDGVAAVSAPLPGFPGGLLVVHDGENTPDEPGEDGEPRPNTNFKYLDAGFLGAADR